jgi:uncharacterized membrane protein YedE/YeeE
VSAGDIKRIVSAFAIGVLFALGLIVSQMVNPAKIFNFLDIFGAWDPSLLFVMLGAIPVTFIGYRLVFRSNAPLLDGLFRLPASAQIDRKLLIGATIFGVGWGLSGLCPAPALVGMGMAIPQITVFVISLIIGINIYRIIVNFNKGK